MATITYHNNEDPPCCEICNGAMNITINKEHDGKLLKILYVCKHVVGLQSIDAYVRAPNLKSPEWCPFREGHVIYGTDL